MVKAFINDQIASTLISAGIMFAKRSITLSKDSTWDGVSVQTIYHEIENRRVIEQTIGAVIVAVAGVEGMINEILVEATEHTSRSDSMVNVSDEAYLRWARMWNQGVFERGLNALDKCQLALEIADLPIMPPDEAVIDNMKVLIALRNALVHSAPKMRPHGPDWTQSERDSLERKLTGKFEVNKLVPQTDAFIWQRCLGAGCARWSAQTASDFQNLFFRSLGNPVQAEILWDQ